MTKIAIDAERCKGCGLCAEVCPKEVLKMSNCLNQAGYHPAMISSDECVGCTDCAIICPDVAIEVYME